MSEPPPPAFHRFRDLPPELRERIWKWTFPPCIVNYLIQIFITLGPSPVFVPPCIDFLGSEARDVNSESRSLLKASYQTVFAVNWQKGHMTQYGARWTTPRPTLFNPEIDLIFLEQVAFWSDLKKEHDDNSGIWRLRHLGMNCRPVPGVWNSTETTSALLRIFLKADRIENLILCYPSQGEFRERVIEKAAEQVDTILEVCRDFWDTKKAQSIMAQAERKGRKPREGDRARWRSVVAVMNYAQIKEYMGARGAKEFERE